MKVIRLGMLVALSMMMASSNVHAYTFGFVNHMPGPVDVRIRLSGINEPWYTHHLRGAKESGATGKSHDFIFASGGGRKWEFARKAGFCLSDVQVQPYEYDEIKGRWTATGIWYDTEPLFLESETYTKTLQAASQFANGLNKMAGNTLKLLSKGLKYLPTSDEDEQEVEEVVEVTDQNPPRVEDTRLMIVSPALKKAVASRDLYTILGVSKNATQDEIRSAYKKKALQWHPDKNRGNEVVAEAKFKEIAVAYEILCDMSKRNAYDHKTMNVTDTVSQAVVQNDSGDWQLKPEASVTVAERQRSGLRLPSKKTIESVRKGAKSIRKTIEGIPLGEIIENAGTLWSHSMCKTRTFQIVPNIDTEGVEHEGPLVTTKAR